LDKIISWWEILILVLVAILAALNLIDVLFVDILRGG